MTYDPAACGALCHLCVLKGTREGDPVPPEFNDHALFAVVAEAPGPDDALAGRPLVGQGGQFLRRSMSLVDAARGAASYHYTLPCRPPANNLKRVLTRLSRQNKKRRAEGLDPLPTPMECCKPRLLNELGTQPNLLLLGKVAYETVTPGPHRAIDAVQGSLMEVDVGGMLRKVAPAFHPSRVLKELRLKLPFDRAIARAVRWFRGQLRWEEPALIIAPPLDWLREYGLPWLWNQPLLHYDTETNDIEPLRAETNLVQIGNRDMAIVLPFGSKEGKFYYTDAELREIAMMLAPLLEGLPGPQGQRPALAGHNAGSYDRQGMLRWGLRWLGRPLHVVLAMDTLTVHRHVDPDLPHSLGFVGSVYTDIHDWKGDGKEGETDEAHFRYGGLDVVANARVTVDPGALLDQVADRDRRTATCSVEMQPLGHVRLARVPGAADPTLWWGAKTNPVLWHDHQMQGVCVEMHWLGMRVNQEKRAWAEAVLVAEERKWLNRLQEIMIAAGYRDLAGWESDDLALEYDVAVRAGDHKAVKRIVREIEKLGDYYDGKGGPRFNPRSGDDLRTLLFDRWDLPLPEVAAKFLYVDNGDGDDRSVADVILRAYLADTTLSEEQHAIIHAARRAKKFRTLHSRFLRKLRPFEEWAAADRAALLKGKARPGIVVWEDGRARFNWNAHGTLVGRLSSGGRPSRINAQTFPEFLRYIFEPSPGHKFVNADLAAAHLRLIANLWRIPSLVDDFTQGRDPHETMARMVIPDFDKLPGHPEYEVVDGVKRKKKGSDWSGAAKKMRNIGKQLRFNGAYGGEPPSIHATMTRAEDENGNLSMRSLTRSKVQEYHARWMGSEPQWRQAWDRELRLFREHGYMLSPLLGRRADFLDGEDRNKIINYRILSGEADIMGPATVRVAARIRPGSWSPTTGIVGQFHDAILLEVPEDRVAEAKAVLEEEMTLHVPGWPVPMTCDAKAGDNWKEV